MKQLGGIENAVSRRVFVKGALATCALASFGGVLAACGSNGQGGEASAENAGGNQEASSGQTAEQPVAQASEQQATAASANSTLVVYFSATGHTKVAAEAIASTLGADTFVITPEQPYTSDDLVWQNDASRVNVEHNNPDGRHVQLQQATIPNLDSYSTVFFGYPTWWGGASWVVDDIATSNDFTGKTVQPFTTSSSSPLGTSASNLAALAGTGNWNEGMRFASSVTADEVVAWLNGLDI